MKNVLTTMLLAVLTTALVPAYAGGPDVSSDSSASTNVQATTGAEASNAGNNQGQAVTFEGTKIPSSTTLKNVPSMVAPGLTTTMTETCMGSTSTSVAAAGVGVAFGTTWRDTSCVRRLDAREIRSFGDVEAAKEIMCESDSVREAFKRVGRPCFLDRPKETAASN